MQTKAIYPGTFDPFTNGHLNITKRAAKQYNEVIITVSDHARKKTLFTIEERVNSIQEVLKAEGINNVTVKPFTNLLADFAKEEGADVVIRGLRVNSDFEYEYKMAQFIREMHEEVEVIYLMAPASTLHISSSHVKEIALLNGDVSSYVPAFINSMLKDKVNSGDV